VHHFYLGTIAIAETEIAASLCTFRGGAYTGIIMHFTGWPKKLAPFLYTLILPNITYFHNYFTRRIRRKFVIILSLKSPPHLKCVFTPGCEMSSVLKAIIENETTSVTTYFKKFTTGNNVFIVSVIV